MDESNYRKRWLEWLKSTTDLSFETYLDPTDLCLNSEPDFTNIRQGTAYEDSEGEFSSWTKVDVTLSHLYGLNAAKGFFGEYSRWAEKMACIQMKGRGFFPVIDKNIEHYMNFLEAYQSIDPSNDTDSQDCEYRLLQWAKRLPHYDVSGRYSDQEFNFDVKCHVNPKNKDFRHKLYNLKVNEGIYFMRIYPRSEYRKNGSIGKHESVGYLLYEDLIKLFSLDESFKNHIPGYFFYNGNIGDLISFRSHRDYLEAPLLMLKIENGQRPSELQLEQIKEFISFSKNNDGKVWMDNFSCQQSFKKVG